MSDSFRWYYEDSNGAWWFGGENQEYDVASVNRITPGHYHITWYTSQDEDEESKETEFHGSFKDARAYAACLARLGVPE